ncbi:hypothetical protein Tco_1065214, partial [Tanacetum coccineum]
MIGASCYQDHKEEMEEINEIMAYTVGLERSLLAIVSVQKKQAARVQLGITVDEKTLTNQQQGIQNLVPAQAKLHSRLTMLFSLSKRSQSFDLHK